MEISIITQTSKPVLSIRAKVPEAELPAHVVKCYELIAAYILEFGEQPSGEPFIAYYNIDTENLRGNGIWDMEVGLIVDKVLPSKGEIIVSELINSKAVTCIYKGAYRGMGRAYSLLTEWIKNNEYQFANISYEYYLNSPADVSEDELLTKLVMLIR